MSSKPSNDDSNSFQLTKPNAAEHTTAKQPLPETDVPQSSTDTANPDAPLTAQAPLRTAPAEDPVPAPDQNSENLAKKSVGNNVQESAATAPLSVSGRNESTSEQTTNSTDDSDTLNFPEELNTLKHELSAINIDQTTRLVTVENRLNRLRKLLPPDSLQLTETLAALTASLQIKLAQNAGHQLRMESATKILSLNWMHSSAPRQSIHKYLPCWKTGAAFRAI